ncbi:ATP-binding protein [Dissulfurirhabdus thermomarina]|uniref:ATP-binding protein n=1 Tax=Dissulfurirhabdus thermomarina TaxID=1765737 RepID=A0A6N9TSV0_DISTH|nr:ATP-binding protein [Dissulfurirhabdus thermomarina]NDY41616.1 ATP-binding protein [Dissulfurirhabdus thermomarina]NMX23341.1 ATP-binding protein [Dissulfurirhabdus thermomarina]
MPVEKNPFQLQEIPPDAPFCDRERELAELLAYARAGGNVVVYSPRRYGKTSLVKRVQDRLRVDGAVTVFVDFFGVTSVDDVAARLAKAVFRVTHGREPLWRTALRVMRSFRPVLKPDAGGGFTLTVEPAGTGATGLELLEGTMESLGAFVREGGAPVQVTLDEFQEIVTLRGALSVEAALRRHIQGHRASYFFVGSRRRVLLGIFNERQRPFFRAAINYPLGPLPPEDLARYLVERFAAGGRTCPPEVARRLVELAAGHPYYAQKLAFLLHTGGGRICLKALDGALERLVRSEAPVFEAVLQGISPHQRRLLRALAFEPSAAPLGAGFIQRHGLGSVGGVQHSLRRLEELDLVERPAPGAPWRVVDPVLGLWLRRQEEDRLPGPA